jgi:hypothetical protein
MNTRPSFVYFMDQYLVIGNSVLENLYSFISLTASRQQPAASNYFSY